MADNRQHKIYGYNFFTDLRKAKIRTHMKILNNRFGLLTDIYYPVTELTVYGHEDISIRYAENPSETNVRLFIPGLLKDMSRSIEIIDPYYSDVITWYDPYMTRTYDHGTMLCIKLGASSDKLVMKIDNYTQSPGGADPIYMKYVLVPAA